MVEWVQNVVHSFKRVPTKRVNEKWIRRPPFNEKTTTDLFTQLRSSQTAEKTVSEWEREWEREEKE